MLCRFVTMSDVFHIMHHYAASSSFNRKLKEQKRQSSGTTSHNEDFPLKMELI